jgi:hypothetical protein
LVNILRQEISLRSTSNLFYAGLPTVVAYHVSDWVAFFIETMVDAVLDEYDEEQELPQKYLPVKRFCQGM